MLNADVPIDLHNRSGIDSLIFPQNQSFFFQCFNETFSQLISQQIFFFKFASKPQQALSYSVFVRSAMFAGHRESNEDAAPWVIALAAKNYGIACCKWFCFLRFLCNQYSNIWLLEVFCFEDDQAAQSSAPAAAAEAMVKTLKNPN